MPTLSIDGKLCFYQDVGKGFPILFGHSYLWDSHMWAPQIEELSSQFRCIAIDLWSHGRSGSLNSQSYTLDEMVADAWKVLDHLNITEFALVGLSVGGMWGAKMALDRPLAVKALVLMDTFLGKEPFLSQQKYFILLDMLEKENGFSPWLIERVAPLFFSPYTMAHQKELVAKFKEVLGNLKKENIPGIVTIGRAIFSRPNLLDHLPKITQPTMIITGKDDIPRPPKEAEEMKSYLPNATCHIIDNAGHISNLEQKEVVSSLLQSFLRNACLKEPLFT